MLIGVKPRELQASMVSSIMPDLLERVGIQKVLTQEPLILMIIHFVIGRRESSCYLWLIRQVVLPVFGRIILKW